MCERGAVARGGDGRPCRALSLQFLQIVFVDYFVSEFLIFGFAFGSGKCIRALCGILPLSEFVICDISSHSHFKSLQFRIEWTKERTSQLFGEALGYPVCPLGNLC